MIVHEVLYSGLMKEICVALTFPKPFDAGLLVLVDLLLLGSFSNLCSELLFLDIGSFSVT